MLTATTSIIAARNGASGPFYGFLGKTQTLSPNRTQGKTAIYEWAGSRYAVIYRNPTGDSSTTIPTLATYKNTGNPWTEQDSGNRPNIFNANGADGPNNSAAAYFDVAQISNLLYLFYFTNDNSNAANSRLAFKTYDMATDTYGSQVVSTLTIGVAGGNDIKQQISQGQVQPGFTISYDSRFGTIWICGKFGIIAGLNGKNYDRPAYAQYSVGGGTWSGSWTTLGDLTGAVETGQYSFSSCIDCRGALDVISTTFDVATSTNKILLQTVYTDLSVSAVQTITTFIDSSAGAFQTDGKVICSGTELILPFGMGLQNPTNRRLTLKVARATVSGANVLPSSWTIQTVHTDDGNPLEGYQCFIVSGQLLAIYVKDLVASSYEDQRLTCATESGGVWTDAATPGATVVLGLYSVNEFGTLYALITYDFVAPTTGSSESGLGFEQMIYALATYTVKVCPLLEIDRTAADTLSLGDSSNSGGPAGISSGTGYVFEYETGVGRRATWEE